MFKKKKTGCETPKFRKPTVPPQPTVPPMPPTTGSNAFKPNPNYIPPATVKKTCHYETPCGWCTKWDKKCDRKPYKRGLRVEINPIDDAIGNDIKEYIKTDLINKVCESEEDHEYECCGMSTEGSSYMCKKCGKYKFEPYTTSTSNYYKGEN